MKYAYNSPYAFSENKVTSHIELEGLESVNINIRHFKSDFDKFRTTPRSGGGQLNVKINLGDQKVSVEGNKGIKNLKFTSTSEDGVTTIKGSYKFAASSPNGFTNPNTPANFEIKVNADLPNNEMSVNTSIQTIAPAAQIETIASGDIGGDFITGTAGSKKCDCITGELLHPLDGNGITPNNLGSRVKFKTELYNDGKTLLLDKISVSGSAYKSRDKNNKEAADRPIEEQIKH